MLRPRLYSLHPIADTAGDFADFRPYVASIDDRGVVAFQAALADGETGVFTGDGGPIRTVVRTRDSPLRAIISHPDINPSGAVSFYAELRAGGAGVFLARDGHIRAVADTRGGFSRIGPLGPTMNERGLVAFRADTEPGVCSIWTGDGEAVTPVIDTASGAPDAFAGFEGLPVVTDSGDVVFRGIRRDGCHGVYRRSAAASGVGAADATPIEIVADTRHRFRALGRFPSVAGRTVAFVGALASGVTGVFTVTDGQLATAVDTRDAFEHVRGALVNRSGALVYYATPPGGAMSIYAGPDPVADRVLSIGDPMLGSRIAAFVLNPVSINERGQLAIRVELADGRQAIARADPTP